MKSIYSLAGAALVAAAVSMSAAAPAHALTNCTYRAVDNGGHMIEGSATASRLSTACRRALRRCNRKVDRGHRRGEFGRTTGCHRLSEVQG